MENKKQLVMIDELLEKIDGHNFEYIKSVKEIYEQKGYAIKVYANANVIEKIQTEIGAIPYFKFDPKVWYRKIFLIGSILYRIIFWIKLHKQYAAIVKENENNDEAFFVPNIYWYHISSIFKAFKNIKVKSYFLLRLSCTDSIGVPSSLKSIAISFFNKGSKIAKQNNNIILTTDSAVIANEWHKIYNQKLRVLPIPHIKEPETIASVAKTENKIRLYSPGVMRMEKGMKLIFDSLQIIENTKQDLANKLEFVVQIFGEREKEQFEFYKTALAQFKNIKITILGSLSSVEYNAQVYAADIILIPYIAAQGYQARTSGVLCEAIGAQKIFITSKNTWMENVAQQYNTGVSIMEMPQDFIQALELILNNKDAFQTMANNAKKDFLAFHSGEKFFEVMEE
jgi:glycosyltransferase involved in cell wall biosynthesis